MSISRSPRKVTLHTELSVALEDVLTYRFYAGRSTQYSNVRYFLQGRPVREKDTTRITKHQWVACNFRDVNNSSIVPGYKGEGASSQLALIDIIQQLMKDGVEIFEFENAADMFCWHLQQ